MQIIGLSLGIGTSSLNAVATANAIQCDKFMVVGAKDDVDLQRLCSSIDLQFITFSPNGRGLNLNFSTALAAGIRHIRSHTNEADAWIVVMPPGVIVSSDFRDRLHALRAMLDSETVYAIRHERLCLNSIEFETLAASGIWDRNHEQNDSERGTLFLANLNNSRFSEFEPNALLNSLRETSTLPFVALRAPRRPFQEGNSSARVFDCLEEGPFFQSWKDGFDRVFERIGNLNCKATFFLTGIERSAVFTFFAQRFEHLHLIDSRNLSRLSSDKLEEIDRGFCWQKIQSQLKQLNNVSLIGSSQGTDRS